MPHHTTEPAEQFLDKELRVLDKGFIRLVDYMGGDKRVVDAARVSYQGGTKQVRKDEQLIRYLLRHKHTTPFEKVRFEFHVKLPIFIARQWMRHRMSSFNEMSARYSVLEDEFYFPAYFREQSSTNKQGSGDMFDPEDQDHMSKLLHRHCEESYTVYDNYIADDVAREQARMVLPVNIYTQFYWTTDLWNLMHFMKLRSDSHAQQEIREYSQKIEDIVSAVCPISYRAWKDYIRDAQNFSRTEVQATRAIFDQVAEMVNATPAAYLEDHAANAGMTTRTPSGKLSREFKEFLAKLNVSIQEG